VIGKDTFAFDVYPYTNEILPFGLTNYGVPYDKDKGYTKYATEGLLNRCKTASGWVCTALVVVDGFKMNHF